MKGGVSILNYNICDWFRSSTISTCQTLDPLYLTVVWYRVCGIGFLFVLHSIYIYTDCDYGVYLVARIPVIISYIIYNNNC